MIRPVIERLVTWTQRPSARQIAAVLALASLLFAAGCPSSPDPVDEQDAIEQEGPLRLLVVDDPEMQQEIERQWQARAGGELQVTLATSQELLESAKCPAVDAIVYPSGLIGELAQRRWISAIDGETVNDPAFARRDILDLVRRQEIAWGEEIYAVPLGSPTLMLLYRKDLLEQLALAPPETWEDYVAVATALADPDHAEKWGRAEGDAWAGTLEPLGPGWAGQTLLAHAAAYIRHRSYFSTLFDTETMEPLIATEPFVRALEQLTAAVQLGSEEPLTMTPRDAYEELLGGRCGMAMTWLMRPQAAPAAAGQLGVVELPGSKEVYNQQDQRWDSRDPSESGRVTTLAVSGRLGSVTRSSVQRQAALRLVLLRLSGPEWSLEISPKSLATTVFRASQEDDVALWTGDDLLAETRTEYVEALSEAYRRSAAINSIRIPGRRRYLAALDAAVQRAVRGEVSPQECLDAAAAEFRKITSDIGVERQKAAYWASLGMEP